MQARAAFRREPLAEGVWQERQVEVGPSAQRPRAVAEMKVNMAWFVLSTLIGKSARKLALNDDLFAPQNKGHQAGHIAYIINATMVGAKQF